MSLQVIRVMETNEEAQTDLVYVDFVCKKYYSQQNVTYSDVFLGGKQNYSNKKIKNHILNLIKMNSKYGQSVVVYFIDSDQDNLNFKMGSRGKNIIEYCLENGYELVFFVSTIEHVFWKKKVDDKDKKEYSIKFINEKQCDNTSVYDLKKQDPHNMETNIMLVLDKYLKKKIN